MLTPLIGDVVELYSLVDATQTSHLTKPLKVVTMVTIEYRHPKKSTVAQPDSVALYCLYIGPKKWKGRMQEAHPIVGNVVHATPSGGERAKHVSKQYPCQKIQSNSAPYLGANPPSAKYHK